MPVTKTPAFRASTEVYDPLTAWLECGHDLSEEVEFVFLPTDKRFAPMPVTLGEMIWNVELHLQGTVACDVYFDSDWTFVVDMRSAQGSFCGGIATPATLLHLLRVLSYLQRPDALDASVVAEWLLARTVMYDSSGDEFLH